MTGNAGPIEMEAKEREVRLEEEDDPLGSVNAKPRTWMLGGDRPQKQSTRE